MHSDERDVQHRAQHDACTVARASDNVGKKLKTVGTCRVIAGYIWVTMSTQPSKRFAMVAAQQRAVQHCSAARILFSTTAPASTVRFDRRRSSLGRCSETRSLVLTRTLCRTRRSRGSRRKQTGSCETREARHRTGENGTQHTAEDHIMTYNRGAHRKTELTTSSPRQSGFPRATEDTEAD